MDDRQQVGRSHDAERLAQYDDLVRFSRIVNSERTFDALLEFIVREAAIVMRADRSSIFLLDAEKNELWAKIALGVGDQVIRFPATRGIAGHVVTTRALVNVPDPYADARFNPAVDKQTGYRTRSILCAPLCARDGRVIGALQVLNKLDGGPFTVEDEHVIETLASQCAAAIENALLYDQLRAAEASGVEPKSTSPKLLFADDDAALVRSVNALLGGDFEIVRALDEDDLLRKLQNEQPDLVLLAVDVGGNDGFETCRALRTSPAGGELPIIMLSTSTRTEDVIRAFEAGANDYIVKPFAPAQLRAKAHTWLLRTARPKA